jgi:hypothetical protein
MLNVGRHTSVHFREEQAKYTLTILPIQVVQIHLLSIVSLVGWVSAVLRQIATCILLHARLLHLALVKLVILTLRLQVYRLCRVRLSVEPPRFPLSGDLLPDFLLYLLKRLQKELFNITPLIKNDLAEGLNLSEFTVFTSHDFS